MQEQNNASLPEQLEPLLAAGDTAALEALVGRLHPADLARLLAELPAEDSVAVFNLLPDAIASEVLDETPELVREELVERVDDRRLADLLGGLPEDDAARFLAGLPEPTAARLFSLMPAHRAAKVRQLLTYAAESAGRLMSTEVVVLRREWTVAEALGHLRSLGAAAETLYYLYVVDERRRLVGMVPLRAILLAQPDAAIDSLMNKEVITIPASADREQLAEFIARYDFVAIPVVDEDGRLLGVVTVDDALDVITEEATEDMQRLGGSEPLAAPYFAAPVWKIAGKRIVWLLPLFAASVLTDMVIGSYEGLLAHAVVLAVFIPVVSGTAGNAGSQTVTTIIRALGTGDMRVADTRRAWLRELAVALLLGLCLAAAGYLRALWIGAGATVALVLAVTLPAVILFANTMATLVPFVAQRLRVDPAVVSTPMIATLADAVGILIYLSIANAALT